MAVEKKTFTFKEPGRKPGTPNNANGVLRNEKFNIRCSEGFNNVVDELVATGQYKSKADVLHEALQHLAMKKLSSKKSRYWIQKI